jgi:phospholipase C
MVRVSSDAPYVPDVDPSPSHEFHDVMLQLYLKFTVPNPMPFDGLNMGFMYDYAKVSHDVAHAGKVMRCFGPGKLSALHALAEEFAICDHWFSSLPGPTWPNRFFLHCATSGGYVDNTVREYPMKTIFQNLEASEIDFRIYFHDFPQSLVKSATILSDEV